MKSIRCGRGLGDSIYLQSVVRHLVRDGRRMKVMSDWPDVFLPLGGSVEVAPFTREGVTMTAHYVMRKTQEGTTQFEDCCRAAGISDPVELKLDWPEPTSPLVQQLRERGKPIVCVQMPRNPMGREDGYGRELLPDCAMLQRLIDGVKDVATVVQVGAGKPLFEFRGIDVDLGNRTSVRELIDVAAAANGFLGYCSFILPLAESLDKPLLLVWSRKGLNSAVPFIAQVTPRKLLHKPSSMWIMDDAPQQRFEDSLDEFRRLVARR